MVRLSLIFLACTISLHLFIIVNAQTPSEYTASITGRVTVSGKPAVNALVTMVEVDPKMKITRIVRSNGREYVDRQAYKATTNADGIYLFTGLPAGHYKVSALSTAYVWENRVQGDDISKQLTLDEGETREKVDFSLIRGGVITGRVTDDENRPQIGRIIRLTELLADGQKRELSSRVRQSFETDDRGVFRIYGLRTGRYLVGAGGESYVIEGKKFDRTYHPNTTNAEQAQVIEVKEGREIAGIDISLVSSGKSYDVMGRVIEAVNGKTVPQIRVYCIAVANQDDDYGNGVSEGLTDIEGNFQMTGLKPGKYKVILNSWRVDHPFYADGKYFEINSENATGIELIVKRGGTVSGVVALEGGKDSSIEAKLYQCAVHMDVRSIVNVGYKNEASNFSELSPGGRFHFIGLPPGKLHLNIGDGNRSFHLLRVERDGNVQPDGIEVGPGENITGVKLIVAHGEGVIRGVVKVIGGTLPENSNVSVRAKLIGSMDYSKSAPADGKGRFLIEGLLYGQYILQISYSYPEKTSSRHVLLQPEKQNFSVTGGAETSATITLNLNQRDQ